VTGLDWAGLGWAIQYMWAHSVFRFPAGARGLGGTQAKWGGRPAASSFTHKVRRGMSGRGSAVPYYSSPSYNMHIIQCE